MEKTLHHFYELKNKRVHAELFTCNLPDPLYLILNRPRRTLERQQPGQHQTTYLNIECVGHEGRNRRPFHSISVNTTSKMCAWKGTRRMIRPHQSGAKFFPPPVPDPWCQEFHENGAGAGREQTTKLVQRLLHHRSPTRGIKNPKKMAPKRTKTNRECASVSSKSSSME